MPPQKWFLGDVLRNPEEITPNGYFTKCPLGMSLLACSLTSEPSNNFQGGLNTPKIFNAVQYGGHEKPQSPDDFLFMSIVTEPFVK